MKALVLDGSENDASPLSLAGDQLMERLVKSGREPVRTRLRNLTLKACQGCFQCWDTHPGLCHFEDDGVGLTRCLAQSDALVLLTPVSFGGYSSAVKCAMERAALPNLLPFFKRIKGEIHHPLRYGKPIRLLAVGALRKEDAGSENIFRTILSRNAKNQQSPAFGAVFVYDGMTSADIEKQVQCLALETLEVS
jgi:multimeric flavodoxin WrbA